MTLYEAMLARRSLRSYLPEPISTQQRRQLGKAIDLANRRSGLRIRLLCDLNVPVSAGYGLLTGVRNYLVLAGPEDMADLEEKCGYYGEQLVLTAVSMGLGTCWLGATFDKKLCSQVLTPGEKLVCAVAVGHVPQSPTGREKLIYMVAHRKTKTVQELSNCPAAAPAWFTAGVEAVQLAPSAMNRQGVCFDYTTEEVLGRVVEKSPFALVDLGIAKYHFELGAHGGTWTWGDGGSFRKAQEEKSCGAVIWRGTPADHQYLLARHNGGHWSFPKGHVEGDETEIQTAQREILEETGLTAEIDDRFRQVVTYYPKPGVIKDVIFFTAQPTGGAEHAQEEEIAQIGWFSYGDARDLLTFATDEEVLLAAETYLTK